MRPVRRLFLVLFITAACGNPSSTVDAAGGDDASVDSDAPVVPLTLPPVNAKVDYQLGGAYPPPSGVTVVSRDRNDPRVDGLYNICYVNGFQVQPDEEMWWIDNHPDLLLRDGSGNLVRDTQWNEILLDIRLAEQRTAIASIIGTWIRECAVTSFQAVEIDNLDAYTRSQGLLLEHQAIQTMKMMSDHAHAVARPIAQKNSSDLVAKKAEMGTDFAIAEECNRYNECDAYTAGYGDHVIVIEYRQQDFTSGCTAFPNLSIVLRDVNLVTPSSTAYVYDGC
jgi:hypothetical protein